MKIYRKPVVSRYEMANDVCDHEYHDDKTSIGMMGKSVSWARYPCQMPSSV